MAQENNAVHPGLHLLEKYLTPMDVSASQAAAAMRIPERELVEVLAARSPVTLDLAMRLSRVVGQNADYWLSLQGAYDVAQTSSLADELESLQPLVSAYWGRPVAAFFQEIDWHLDKKARCLVICAFSPEGRPTIVLTQRNRYMTPSLDIAFEHHAAACVTAISEKLDTRDFCYREERGWAFFVAHCMRAIQATFACENPTLHGVSAKANLLWAEHYLEGTESWKAEQATIVHFQYKNTPTFGSYLSGVEFQALLGTEVRTLGYRHARD